MNIAVRALILTFALTAWFQSLANAEKPSWEYPTIELPGWHAQAVAVALREFQKNQGGHNAKGEPAYGDLRHYSVKVITMEREVEVRFVPALGPKDLKDITLEGRTQYGIEVSYAISKELKIVKTSFAR